MRLLSYAIIPLEKLEERLRIWIRSVAWMRRYNIWRPIMLIAVALLTRSLVYNLGTLFGMSSNSASNLAIAGMVIAALVMYNRMMNQRRK